MFKNIGTFELLIIALLILLFVGGKKLPELTRSLTQAAKEFRQGLKEDPTPKSKSKKSSPEA